MRKTEPSTWSHLRTGEVGRARRALAPGYCVSGASTVLREKHQDANPRNTPLMPLLQSAHRKHTRLSEEKARPSGSTLCNPGRSMQRTIATAPGQESRDTKSQARHRDPQVSWAPRGSKCRQITLSHMASKSLLGAGL